MHNEDTLAAEALWKGCWKMAAIMWEKRRQLLLSTSYPCGYAR